MHASVRLFFNCSVSTVSNFAQRTCYANEKVICVIDSKQFPRASSFDSNLNLFGALQTCAIWIKGANAKLESVPCPNGGDFFTFRPLASTFEQRELHYRPHTGRGHRGEKIAEIRSTWSPGCVLPKSRHSLLLTCVLHRLCSFVYYIPKFQPWNCLCFRKQHLWSRILFPPGGGIASKAPFLRQRQSVALPFTASRKLNLQADLEASFASFWSR